MLKTVLRTYVKDQETVDRIIDPIQINIGDHLSNGGKAAINVVKETYNLK